MTVTAYDGPLVTKGIEPALGSATGTSGGATGAPGPYVSGASGNPDAGPNVHYDGVAMKDAFYRYNAGGVALAAGGYPNQAVGFIEHKILTIDLVPSAIATANIAALANVASGVAMTLVAATGAGITVTTAAVTVLNTGLVVPTAQRLIDALPAWVGFGASGAIQGWSGAACGRAVSITGAAGSVGGHFIVAGYDLYGRPQTENINAAAATLTNGKKGWKWITSVTPQFTDAHNYSIGTADIFEFPIRADRFTQTEIAWDETWITANTGFVAADTTSPATATTGSTRGTYATQTASDGARRLAVTQRMTPANLNTSPPSTGMFGIVPV